MPLQGRSPLQYTSHRGQLGATARARSLDIEAKLARGECQCDQKCHRRVTAEDVGFFEWDHIMQSFDDPDYRKVGSLVAQGASAVRCDSERAKCRLLHILCHQRHRGKQIRRRLAQKRA